MDADERGVTEGTPMVPLWRLLRAHRGEPARPVERPNVERVVERLSEDEALRDDLTDAGYGPLLGVVSNLAVARGERFSSTDDLSVALRRLLAAAVEAAERSDPAALLAAADPPLIEPTERESLARDLAGLPVSPDEAGPAIARALAASTGVPEPPA